MKDSDNLPKLPEVARFGFVSTPCQHDGCIKVVLKP